MKSLAHPRTVPNTRELSALDLAEDHFEEIAASHRGGRYTLPSLHGEHSYSVIYTARREACRCRGYTAEEVSRAYPEFAAEKCLKLTRNSRQRGRGHTQKW